MHLPTLAPQRSVLRAAFLYDREIFLGSGDFPNVYYRCSLSRAVPISKREVRVSCLPEKRSQSVLVEPPAVLSARHHYTLSNPENPRVAYSAYHEMNFTGFAFYWPLHSFLIRILQSSPCLLHMLSVLDPSNYHYGSDQGWD